MKNKLLYLLVAIFLFAICVGGYVEAQQGPATNLTGSAGPSGAAGPTGPTGPTGSSGGLGTPFSFSLNSAQISVLASSPVTVPALAAPGANKLLVVTQSTVIYTFGTRKYLCSGSESGAFSYVNDPGDKTPTFDWSAAGSRFSDTGASPFFAFIPDDVDSAMEYTAACDFNLGSINTVTINAAGLGYAVGDTGTISTAFVDGNYIITGVGALGVVTSLTASGGQTATTTGSATSTGGGQPGVGTGLTVNITAVNKGDGTATVTGFSKIVTIP